MYFAVSQVELSPFLPFFSALGLAFFCSMSGISGAFLLMPLQLSGFGITQPCVSATNHLFNFISCPFGVYRFYREGRLFWPLALIMSLGTIPGAFLGAWLKSVFLQDIDNFRLFVAIVLLYLALRLLLNVLKAKGSEAKGQPKSLGEAKVLCFSWRILRVSFQEQIYEVRVSPLFALSLFVGIIGGIYGIGGGAIMSPFLVTYFALPLYLTAGATLLCTFLTSFMAVFSYLGLSLGLNTAVAPDWALGLLFGLGGAIGMNLGARLQKHFSPKFLKGSLAFLLLLVALKYLL